MSPAASGAREEAAPDADTGQRLLEAAAGLFAERGYRGATMRAIAARAGVNGAAANYHFGNKQQLYLEVARQRFERLERRLVEGGADPGAEELAGRSPEEFAALLRARIRVFLGTMLEEDPVHGALMLHELATPSEAFPIIMRRWVEPLKRAMERVLARLAPTLPPAAIERCADSVMGQAALFLTHRFALLFLMRRRAYPPGFLDEAADHITSFSLGGLERLVRSTSSARAPRRETRS